MIMTPKEPTKKRVQRKAPRKAAKRIPKEFKEQYDKLPEPYRSQAIENYDPKFRPGQVPKNLDQAIGLGFSWFRSPQGFGYWLTAVENKEPDVNVRQYRTSIPVNGDFMRHKEEASGEIAKVIDERFVAIEERLELAESAIRVLKSANLLLQTMESIKLPWYKRWYNRLFA